MLRVVLGLGMALLTGVVAAGSAAAGDARTTRIEPRGFYGATVSIESGVRVFRPLPRTTHVIINPNKTPLHLSIEESRHVYENNTFRGPDASGSRDAAPQQAGAAVSGLPFIAKHRRRGGRDRVRRRNGSRLR